MEFKFDPNQDYQLDAIHAIVDLFEGHANQEETFTLDQFGVQANPLGLDWQRIKENLRRIQQLNGFTPDEDLAYLEGNVENGEAVRFPNFSVEMETGTGKTYVYLRTALELYIRYGFRKFIVVVPSVAVREGVLKTLEVTKRHFSELYQNPRLSYYAYDSGRLSQVRGFAQSDGLEIMIMTIQSFQGERVVIRQQRDQFQGERPIHLIQATRPVLILDEPQNMESEDRIRALADLNPLFALRYSATHCNPYSLVYRLSPFEAYRRGLVKKIAVAGLVEQNGNRPYIRLERVDRRKLTLTAVLTVDRLMHTGTVRRTTVRVKPGDDLEAKANNPAYKGHRVEEIAAGYVRLAQGLEIAEGEAVGPDKDTIFRAQIRYTLEEHFLKQRRLKEKGIKVLSLFFIDRVANYVGVNGKEGMVRHIFREEFNLLKKQFPEWKEVNPDTVHTAYFAQKPRKSGEITYYEEETNKEAREAFQQAYALIMREKERLLSFDEPVAFIFSHSALREGWDNPNIFQICTLNQTVSLVKKRQEIGRGVRLCVNQAGERVFERQCNMLTVVANEAYEEYVSKLQSEFAEEGLEGYTPGEATRSDRQRGTYRRAKDLTHPYFEELWGRIKHRTRFRLQLDSERLVREVVEVLDQEEIALPKIEVNKVILEADDQALNPVLTAAGKAYAAASRLSMPNLLERIGEMLQCTTTTKMWITRRTLLEILKRTKNGEGMYGNPQAFAVALIRILKARLVDQLADGIRYEKTGEWYEAEQVFAEEFMACVDCLKWEVHGKPLARSMYEAVECESDPESRFLEQLENDPEVLFYVKLPGTFKVPTPLGSYNPDWAVVLRERDAHGNLTGTRLYLVQETKDTQYLSELDPKEQHNVKCGKAHFEALEVPYKFGPNLRE